MCNGRKEEEKEEELAKGNVEEAKIEKEEGGIGEGSV